MANIGTLLKDEIRRLARLEIKSAVAELKKQQSKLRKAVAVLRAKVAELERENRLLRAAEQRSRERARVGTEDAESFRITAKGIRSLRRKLGLSQLEFARLIGVTGQSVYQWEHKQGALRLREKTKLALLEVREIGAREAKRRLEEAEEKERLTAKRLAGRRRPKRRKRA